MRFSLAIVNPISALSFLSCVPLLHGQVDVMDEWQIM
jgi:hypothetical protein